MKRKPNNYWSKERCFKSAARHPTRIAWMKAQMPAYSSAHREGWLEECCAHMPRLRAKKTNWTKKMCADIARKYTTRKAWSNGHPVSYRYAANEGWLKDCTRHMGPPANPLRWTPTACRREVRKFSSRKAWREGSPSGYDAAKRLGIADEFFRSKKWYRCNYALWTPKQLKEVARKYKTRTAWFLGSNATYNVAKQKGCFERCCAHMPRRAL